MKLYEVGAWQRPEGLYDAALAHMAEGFRARSPSLILVADALLAKLEAHAVRRLNLYGLLSACCRAEKP